MYLEKTIRNTKVSKVCNYRISWKFIQHLYNSWSHHSALAQNVVLRNPTLSAKRRLLVGRCHSDTTNLKVQAQLARVAAATQQHWNYQNHRHS